MLEHVTIDHISKLTHELDLFTDSSPISRDLITRHLYPPVPISGNRLVWGFHLLSEAKAAGRQELLCSRDTLAPTEQIITALELENRKGRYTWDEKLNIYNFLCRENLLHGPVTARIEKLLDEGKAPFVQVETFAALPPHIRTLVAENSIDLKTAVNVENLPPAAVNLYRKCCAGLSFSNRKNLLLWISETARRECMHESAVTALTEKICTASHPLDEAVKRRFPKLTKLHNRFDRFVIEHLRNSGVKLAPPPGFEGSRYSVQFSFESERELRRRVNSLNTLIEKSDELFRLLHEAV
jgi:hypothetical protein